MFEGGKDGGTRILDAESSASVVGLRVLGGNQGVTRRHPRAETAAHSAGVTEKETVRYPYVSLIVSPLRCAAASDFSRSNACSKKGDQVKQTSIRAAFFLD